MSSVVDLEVPAGITSSGLVFPDANPEIDIGYLVLTLVARAPIIVLYTAYITQGFDIGSGKGDPYLRKETEDEFFRLSGKKINFWRRWGPIFLPFRWLYPFPC